MALEAAFPERLRTLSRGGFCMLWHELGPFTVFDVETTGMSPANDRIVELAAARVETDGTISRYSSLIHPGRAIPFEAQRIHHISDVMVMNAPKFTQVGYEFLDFANNSTLVAHNARFDLGFLQESLARSGLPLWSGKTLDSLRLTREVFKGLPSYSLQNLRRTFQLEDPFDDMAAHRAGADVEWTVQLIEVIFSELLRRG